MVDVGYARFLTEATRLLVTAVRMVDHTTPAVSVEDEPAESPPTFRRIAGVVLHGSVWASFRIVVWTQLLQLQRKL